MAAVTKLEPEVLRSAGGGQSGDGDLLGLFAAFVALGSGLSFFALSAGGLIPAAGSGSVLPLLAGAASGGWALALTAWGLLALRGGTGAGRISALLARAVPSALPAVAAVVLAVLVWTAMLAPDGERTFNLTLATGLALTLVQLGCHGALRRRSRVLRSSPGILLAGMFGCAVLVAGITTPGLAASTAGDFAVPHGQHGQLPEEHSGHGG